MLRTARIFSLFMLVLSGAGVLAVAIRSSSFPELIGIILVPAILCSPLWLSLLALGPVRPRIETLALLSNKLLVFLLACGLVAIVFSLINNETGLAYTPLMVLLIVASAINIGALNKQRKKREASNGPAPNGLTADS